MTYLGSKTKLKNFIFDVLKRENINLDNKTVLDGFAGTGNFTKLLLSQFTPKTIYLVEKIKAMSYYQQYNLYGLKDKDYEMVIDAFKSNRAEKAYFQKYYSAERNYLSAENARCLDNALAFKANFNANQLGYVVDCLASVINSTATHSAYLKHNSKKMQKDILKIKYLDVKHYQTKLIFLNDDLLNFAEPVDFAYLDPPYNSRNYDTNYHLFSRFFDEQIPPNNVSGVFKSDGDSDLCRKTTHLSALKDILTHLKTNLILFSYNSEGFLSKEKLISLFESLNFSVKYYQIEYQRYTSNQRAVELNKDKPLYEYLFVLRR